jgi:hypothetical protein
MRTLLIAGADPVPPKLREIIDRGSTSVREQRGADAGAITGDFDRVVFWSVGDDPPLASLVRQYAAKEKAERREIVLYVAPDGAESAAPGLALNEIYSWPRDEDRLEMAFLTGA